MKNSDLPVNPIVNTQGAPHHINDVGFREGLMSGLTKREQFCLHMGVPETGDAELDDIIYKGERKRIAAMAMQGIIANSTEGSPAGRWDICARDAVLAADELLEELKK